MVTCRAQAHHPGYFYFCFHCRRSLGDGIPCVDCPERNDRATRQSVKDARNNWNEDNPILLGSSDDEADPPKQVPDAAAGQIAGADVGPSAPLAPAIEEPDPQEWELIYRETNHARAVGEIGYRTSGSLGHEVHGVKLVRSVEHPRAVEHPQQYKLQRNAKKRPSRRKVQGRSRPRWKANRLEAKAPDGGKLHADVAADAIVRGEAFTADVRCALRDLIPALRAAGVVKRQISLTGTLARAWAASFFLELESESTKDDISGNAVKRAELLFGAERAHVEEVRQRLRAAGGAVAVLAANPILMPMLRRAMRR